MASRILAGKLRGVDATTQGHERGCRVRVIRKQHDADERAGVHSGYIHFELVDDRDAFPVGNYEVTFADQTEKLTKRVDGRYYGRQ